MVAGRAQSFIANFERVLVAEFGAEQSLADELRFPIFLSSLTTEALDAIKSLRSAIPRAVVQYITDYDSSLSTETRDDQAYELRVLLIPMKTPKTVADAAITFVDERNLTPDAWIEKLIADLTDTNPVLVMERWRNGPKAAQQGAEGGATD